MSGAMQSSDLESWRVLSAADPAPFEVINADGASPVVLVCEHAGRRVPEALMGLGLAPEEMDKHIAWDIGADGLARRMSALLDAPLVVQRYSRLVIDANRPLQASDCIPEISDRVIVPGNRGLNSVQRQARYDEIHVPFHAAVSDVLDRRAAVQRPTILATVHSFTPFMGGMAREMSVGLLFNRDRRLADPLKDALAGAAPDDIVTLNAPYSVDDDSDFVIPVHGEARGLLHVLIELRNDLIVDVEGQDLWANRLSNALTHAIDTLEISQ